MSYGIPRWGFRYRTKCFCCRISHIMELPNFAAVPLQGQYPSSAVSLKHVSNFLTHLKNIELQVIGFLRCPKNRMVRCLGMEFHLSQPLMGAPSRFLYRLCKKFRLHEVRAGTSGEKSSLFYQLQSPHINFPISFYRIFDRFSGFGKGGRIQNHQIEFFPLLL